MRVVRGPHRAEAEQARRRRGDRQLRDRPGCGVVRPARSFRVDDLVATVEAAGYHAALEDIHAEAADGVAPVRRRFVVAASLSAPLALLSMVMAFQFDGWEWVALALSAPVVLWAGWPFHRAALVNARHAAATMDTLVSVGTLAAFGWSTVVLLTGSSADTYFEAGAVITTLILLGRYLEARAARRSGEAIRALLELGAKDARVLRDGVEVLVPIDELVVGDRFVVRPGEKIATDGVVAEGRSAIDQSMLTGEPVPVDVEPGAAVAGATINTTGRLVVEATKVGADTALAQIAHLVAEAQAGKADVQRLADRVSAVFVPLVIVISLATLVGWLVLSGDSSAAFTAAVAVLIIACPCALGLATPTALMVGTGRGAQLGILIKGPEVLEQTRRISTIVLDKTGTVTEGKMWVDGRRARGRRRPRRARPARRLGGGRERAPDRAGGGRRSRVTREPRSHRSRASRTAAASGSTPSSTVTTSRSADRRCSPSAGSRCRPLSRTSSATRRSGGGPSSRLRSTVPSRACSSSPTGSSRPPRGRSPSCARSGSRPCC